MAHNPYDDINTLACHPERREVDESWADRLGHRLSWALVHRWQNGISDLEKAAAQVADAGRGLETLDDCSLRERADTLKEDLRRYGLRDELVARSFAIVRETAFRQLGMRHFDSQVMGGWALVKGFAAEMATGEGKTLVATLPACTAALAGMPVHIVTVNDYLVNRDAALMLPVYESLGLTVGKIVQGMSPSDRRDAYGCDITYCSNKELVFDYLKDRITLGAHASRAHISLERLYRQNSREDRLLMRGLHFAIVDEADSVLIDEARTPLIISGEKGENQQAHVYRKAVEMAAMLEDAADFHMDEAAASVKLTDAGSARLEEMALPLGGPWVSRRGREELMRIALNALHRYIRDRHYLVSDDGKVQIVDEFTGRVMPDRSWEGGLHQMIEAKEGCAVTGERDTIARITYQRFFRRYLHLAGMTGTAREVAGELWAVYRLKTAYVPTHRPVQRRYLPGRIYPTASERWTAIVEHVKNAHKGEGRPVLIGTRSVEASEHLGRLLADAGLQHQVLNARQDKEEAEIVKKAGEAGRITVATNMAGRGTDIILGPGVAERGGLHVILSERHDAGRIDRQLFGRCARQGDPGSCIAMVSLEDELVCSYLARLSKHAKKALPAGRVTPDWLGSRLVDAAQKAAESLHARIRRDTLAMDKKLDKMLAFTGRVE